MHLQWHWQRRVKPRMGPVAIIMFLIYLTTTLFVPLANYNLPKGFSHTPMDIEIQLNNYLTMPSFLRSQSLNSRLHGAQPEPVCISRMLCTRLYPVMHFCEPFRVTVPWFHLWLGLLNLYVCGCGCVCLCVRACVCTRPCACASALVCARLFVCVCALCARLLACVRVCL